MTKVTLNVDGMMCGHCEAHVNDTVRAALPAAKHVKSDHFKGTTSFEIDGAVDFKALEKAIADTGYKMTGHSEEEVKKRFGLF